MLVTSCSMNWLLETWVCLVCENTPRNWKWTISALFYQAAFSAIERFPLQNIQRIFALVAEVNDICNEKELHWHGVAKKNSSYPSIL